MGDHLKFTYEAPNRAVSNQIIQNCTKWS